MEHLALGPTPWGESCAQLGTSGYEVRGPAECEAYRSQLLRIYAKAHGGPPPCEVNVKGSPHDFGTYYEVFVWFDETTVDAALWIEGHTPESWDAEARTELGLP